MDHLSSWSTCNISLSPWILGSSLYLLATRPFRLQLNQHSYPLPWKQLILATLVFALSQLLVILWQFIDSFTVVHMLQTYGLGFREAIMQKGIYDRGASFIQIGLIVTTTFSFVLIPLLTDAMSDHNHVLMNRYTNASLKITLLISVAAGIGLINILPMMNHVFFKTDQLSFTLSIYMLTVIGVSLIMMDIALLQVMNQIRPIFIGVMSGLLFKIIFNVIFIHFMGILGASISTVLSLMIFVTILHYEVVKYYRFNRMRAFIVKLMSALIIMSVVIQGLRMLLPPVGRLGSLIELLIIVGIGVSYSYSLLCI